eukprot:4799117-Prymnesium_polylepis.1
MGRGCAWPHGCWPPQKAHWASSRRHPPRALPSVAQLLWAPRIRGRDRATSCGHSCGCCCCAVTGVNSATLHPDRKAFVAGGGNFWVYVHDYETGAELQCNKGHHGPVYGVRFTPGGKTYASGGDDGTIRRVAPPRPCSAHVFLLRARAEWELVGPRRRFATASRTAHTLTCWTGRC